MRAEWRFFVFGKHARVFSVRVCAASSSCRRWNRVAFSCTNCYHITFLWDQWPDTCRREIKSEFKACFCFLFWNTRSTGSQWLWKCRCWLLWYTGGAWSEIRNVIDWKRVCFCPKYWTELALFLSSSRLLHSKKHIYNYQEMQQQRRRQKITILLVDCEPTMIQTCFWCFDGRGLVEEGNPPLPQTKNTGCCFINEKKKTAKGLYIYNMAPKPRGCVPVWVPLDYFCLILKS